MGSLPSVASNPTASVAVWSDPEELRTRLVGEFARLLGILATRCDIDEVWRFGSTVSGRLHATSDLDVLVVQRTSLDPVERAVALRRQLGPRAALDLFVVTPQEFAVASRFHEHVRATGRRER